MSDKTAKSSEAGATAHSDPKPEGSRNTMWALVALIVGVVAYGIAAATLAPNSQGLSDAAIGLGTAIVLAYTTALIAAVVVVLAVFSARRRHTQWATPTAITTVVAWYVIAAMLLLLLTVF